MADIWSFLTTAANWSGENGIATRIATHLWVSVLAVVVAIAIALPLGALIGHARKGVGIGISVANLSRAIPSLAILAFVVAAGVESAFCQPGSRCSPWRFHRSSWVRSPAYRLSIQPSPPLRPAWG